MSIQSNMLSIMGSASGIAKNIKTKSLVNNPNLSNTAMGASAQIGASSAEYDSQIAQQALSRVEALQNAKIAQKTNITGGNNGSQIT